MDIEHERRLTALEERSKSNTHRIDKLEPIVGEIHKMSETLVEMTGEIKHTNHNVEEIKDKVDKLEQEPAKRWKNITDKLVGAFFGAVGAALACAVIYMISNFM